jgi:hypothetical protein
MRAWLATSRWLWNSETLVSVARSHSILPTQANGAEYRR